MFCSKHAQLAFLIDKNPQTEQKIYIFLVNTKSFSAEPAHKKLPFYVLMNKVHGGILVANFKQLVTASYVVHLIHKKCEYEAISKQTDYSSGTSPQAIQHV